MSRRALLAAALAVPVVGCGTTVRGGFAVENVRIFDGETVTTGSVLVSGAVIAAVGARVEVPDGVPVWDGQGLTLLPGLVDAHSHLLPSADPPRFGVTTELEMGSLVELRGDVRARRESTAPTDKADIWSAGTLVTVPGGHGTQAMPGIPTLAGDPVAFVDARVEEGADHLKLVLERKNADGSAMPTLSEAQVRALVGAARARGLRTLAHVTETDDALMAIDAGISGFAHVCADRPVSREVIEKALAAGVFMVATNAFDKTWSQRRFGPRDIYTDRLVEPFLSPSQRAVLDLPVPPSPWMTEAWQEQGLANAVALHEAGVPVLAGTDAPIPGLANGISLLAAVEALVGASMSPVAALASVTSVPARVFGLADRGRIEPGRRADLVLVQGDPTATITDLRAIRAVWKNGHQISR